MHSTSSQCNIRNSRNDHEAPAATFGGAERCFVCDYPVTEPCFCKIHDGQSGTKMLCCPDCVMQHLEAARDPLDFQEQELRGYEGRMHFFIGEDKPWS